MTRYSTQIHVFDSIINNCDRTWPELIVRQSCSEEHTASNKDITIRFITGYVSRVVYIYMYIYIYSDLKSMSEQFCSQRGASDTG